MGGFSCPCGSEVEDNTDFLPYKARLVADQDFEDFEEAAAASNWNAAHDLIKATVYQCPSCSRLLVVTKNGLRTFTPDTDSSGLLGSTKGEEWRRFLIGHWSDSEMRGSVYWGDSGIKEGDNGYVFLNTREEVEKLYYEVFQRLSSADKLRSALLRVHGGAQKVEDVHDWKYSPEWK